MTSVSATEPWGVLAAATAGTTGAVADGSLVGPRWVIGSIGVIQRQGHELLVAVLSDHNPAQGPAISAARDSPLAPGPPGLTSRIPCCRLAWAVAGIMSSARLRCLPPGSA